ncbi:MAG: hypoxanthine phosphoribosyltransferase [Cyclobacteriaceae bacterium]
MTEQFIKLHDKEFELFLSGEEIGQAIAKLAEQLNKDYLDKEVVIIGVLDGVFMLLGDLLKKLHFNISVELIKLKSYADMKSSGQINELIGLTQKLTNKEVLLVEDIIDTGLTVSHAQELIRAQRPTSLKILTLLIKKEVFKDRFPIDYYGIDIPNRFVVGYGMDHNGLGRQLGSIYVVKED